MKQLDQPAISVILITPDTYDTVARVVSCLQVQTARERIELIIVGAERDNLLIKQEQLTAFSRYRIVTIGEIRSSAFARAAGARKATAPLVGFVEDHAFPAPDWAEHLIKEHQHEWAGVAPEILNANPNSHTSWANLFLAHGKWVATEPEGIRDHLPPHNTVYKREILLAYGQQLDSWLEAEGLMQDDLRSKGHQLYFQTQAKMKHLNISALQPFIIEQYSGGRVFGANRSTHWPWWKRMIYIVGSPLIPLHRLPGLLAMIKQAGRWQELMPLILPSLLFGLTIHSFGEMMGYAFGVGQTQELSTRFEFHHDRYLCARDQNWEQFPIWI